jgi:hypothetical protein
MLGQECHGTWLTYAERLFRLDHEFPRRNIPQNDKDGISARRELVLFHGVLTTGTLHFRASLALKTLALEDSLHAVASGLRGCIACIEYIGISKCHVLVTKVEEGGVATTFCCRLCTSYLVQHSSSCLNVRGKGVIGSLMRVKTRKEAANIIQGDR